MSNIFRRNFTFKFKNTSGLLLILLFNLNIHLKAQQINTRDSVNPMQLKTKRILLPDINGQLDIIDIINFEINTKEPKLLKKKKKPIGNGPFISMIPAGGYSISTGLTGVVATGISFYTDSSKTRLSTILSSYNYSVQNQFWTIHNLNIFFLHEKLNFSTNWRFYSYPTYTFGLGGNTKPSDAFQINYNYLCLYQILYREIGNDFFIGGGYMLDYHWDIREIPNNNQIQTDYDKYGFNSTSISSGISLNLQFDNRASSINPQDGIYGNIRYRNNLKFLGSDSHWQSLLIDVRKYLKFPEESNNILSLWSYNALTLSGTPPYLDLPSTGWDDYSNTGRGYMQGRFRAKNLLDFETEYRISITRNGLLGTVIFGDIESVSDKVSNKFNSLIPGGGIGLRIKTNKKSNTNVAIDYGFGKEGSRGFYFNLGEVF